MPDFTQTGQRILVVDDSRVVLLTVTHVLEEAGFLVSAAPSGEEALAWIRKFGLPHLMLVDINMPPGMDGFAVCEQVHSFSDLPIILLTAVDEEESVVRGLEQHAEDYITKPFRSTELVARVRRVLQRMGDYAYTLTPDVQVDASLQVNLPQRTALVNGKLVTLTPTEARLLYLLLKNAGRLVPTELLLRRVWPLDEAYEDRLHAHIYRLRHKIEPDPKAPHYILSEYGAGYRFLAPER